MKTVSGIKFFDTFLKLETIVYELSFLIQY